MSQTVQCSGLLNPFTPVPFVPEETLIFCIFVVLKPNQNLISGYG